MKVKKPFSIEDLTPFQTRGKKSSFRSGNLFSESQALSASVPLKPAENKANS